MSMNGKENGGADLVRPGRERDLTADIYKGVLIVLVVVRHVLQTSVSDEGGILTNLIWAVQMPGFMLVSGYFAARKLRSRKDVAGRMLLSAQHYALPFFSWFLLIGCLLLGRYGRDPVRALGVLLTRVDNGLWFLWAVFVLSLIAAMANYTMSAEKHGLIKTGIVLAACFGVLLALGLAFGIDFLGIKLILYYAVFYGAGWLIRQTEEIWKAWWPKAAGAAAAVALAVYLAIVFNFDLYRAEDDVKGIILRCAAGFAGSYALLWVCGRYKEKLALFGTIGLYTLEIYAAHIYVNGLIGKGDGFFTAFGFFNFLCGLVLTAVCTVVIVAVFKSIPLTDLVFFGKKKKRA